jgi:putative S-layer y domain protein
MFINNKNKLKKISTLGLMGIMASTQLLTMPYFYIDTYANIKSNFDLRKKVISVTGIMSLNQDMNKNISRAEFALMAVRASKYKNMLTKNSNIALYSDVDRNSEYASAIKIASEKGWMSGYLGGKFMPDKDISLQEAIKVLLYMLGYKAEDFAGDQLNKRVTLYNNLGLGEFVLKGSNDSISRADAVNLFYNLFKTKMPEGGNAYITVLGGSLTSDGEVNALSLADNSLKGPYVVNSLQKLNKVASFPLKEASLYLNGSAVSYDVLSSAMQSSDFGLVIYYSSVGKAVWAYNGSSDTGKQVVHGEISNIYYESSSTLTPSAVTLKDSDIQYKLSSADMQFAFSIYGSLKVGEDVVLIVEKTKAADGEDIYTVVDYVFD